MTSKKIARLALLATVVAAGVLSLGGVAAATTGFWATPAYGTRYAPQASVPNGCTSPDRTCTWVKSSDNLLYYHKTDGTDVNLTTGGGGGGTQGGTTSSTHVPYASGANTLADSPLIYTSGTTTFSAGAATAFDLSGSSGAFKTTTGAFSFGGTTINVPAAATLQSTAQGSTNTTGLTIAPNVADGASSISMLWNTGTALTSGTDYMWKVGGTEKMRLTGNSGFILGGGTYGVYFPQATSIVAPGLWLASVGGTAIIVDAGGVYANSDNAMTNGFSTRRWSTTYSMAYVTGSQSSNLAGTNSITTSSGSLAKLTYQSATNVTAMTLTAGSDGQEFTVMLIQPAAGTAATMVTSWTNVSFAGGAGSFTATLGKRDVYTFVYDGTTSKWYERSRALNLSN